MFNPQNIKHLTFTGFIFLLPFTTHAQLIADFSADTSYGCSPLLINFSDKSTGIPTAWFWDFGNGNTSVLQNPSTVYLKPGFYTVKLIASNDTMSDTLIRNAFIIAYSPPTSNFSATPLTGCAPLPVTFTDRSSPNSSAIVTWYWDFGDGNYSNDRNPKHSYTTGGSFTVALITTDANGCNNYFSIGNYLKIYKPHS